MKNLEIYKSYIKSPYKSQNYSAYFDSYEHFLSKYRGKEIAFVEVGSWEEDLYLCGVIILVKRQE